MEKILGQFESLRAAVFTDNPAPHWSTWNFDRGQIRIVERADGWLLGLVVRADSITAPNLDPLSREFLSVQFGN